MVTTVTDNSPQAINTSLFSLQEQITEIMRLLKELENRIKELEAKH